MTNPRYCLYCKTELLITDDYRKIFCNSSCSAKFNNAKRAVIIFCKNCNTQIKTGNTKQKCCSIHCRDEFRIKSHLREGTTINKAIRNWIYKNLEQKCSVCGIGSVWNNNPLRLQIDHINGNVKDNRLENIRMICPNCHTQTHTWGVKNASPEGIQRMREGAFYVRKKKCIEIL